MSEQDDKMEMVSQVKVKSCEHFDVWEEEWDMGYDTMKMTNVRNKKGDYAGEEDVAKVLEKHGITPEMIDDDSNVCTIGWSEREQKYYGWSHRAYFGFTIGDMIFEEDFDDRAPFIKHGRVPIQNKTDARKSAVNFAQNVS